MDVLHVVLVAAAACAAGVINAIAGGGSLITFPVLIASGIPPVIASMTNTVAMCPGYLGATYAQRKELAGQGGRAMRILPFAVAGSVAGSAILLRTSNRSFETIVPFLLVFAAALLAVQGRVRRYLTTGHHHAARSIFLAGIPIALASVYGAYFGAGLGVILLAVLGAVLDDTLARANAMKQVISLLVNVLAAGIYIAIGTIHWQSTIAIAVGSLVGGLLGGMLVSRIREIWLRGLAIVVALVVAGVYFAKL
ncbi:MAG TPA: sulfite exporter TauE/SafE family protein [Kofleriaceae bacterium]|nr:sulfite exporter TauE/SafE family protein [Kofleriaceae bacterium]